MKKKLSLAIISGLVLNIMFSYSSVFALEPTTDTLDSNIEKREEFKKDIGKMVFGKVTAINGNEITLITAIMPERPEYELSEDDEGRPQRPKRPKRPEIESLENNGEKPEKLQKEFSNDENRKDKLKEIDFTGEEITITISDESVLKTRNRKDKDSTTEEQEALSISDIEVGNILNILYSNDDTEIKEIIIKNFDTNTPVE